MLRKQKSFSQAKHLFRSVYCLECKQKKTCQLLNHEYCCSCFYHQEKEKAQEYNTYKKVFASRQKQLESKIKQLKLLRDYKGCRKCGSYAADAYELYENNQLVCWTCLVKKTGGSSSPVSFLAQERWYKKHWKIDLAEWLTAYDYLPINAKCAKKWLKDKEHLNNCACLEEESQEIYELFANWSKEMEKKLKKCACKVSEKTRVDSDYYTWCESCEKTIAVANKKRVIKNRNNPKFWGLNVKERVLCGECLEKRKATMTPQRRAKFNEYRRLGRL
jgi:hypothetical protein